VDPILAGVRIFLLLPSLSSPCIFLHQCLSPPAERSNLHPCTHLLSIAVLSPWKKILPPFMEGDSAALWIFFGAVLIPGSIHLLLALIFLSALCRSEAPSRSPWRSAPIFFL